MRDPMSRAELYHLARPRNAQPCLERSRLVINTAVDDSAVMSRLVPSNGRLFFQHHDAQARELLGRLHRKRKPNNPAADHRNVISHKLAWTRGAFARPVHKRNKMRMILPHSLRSIAFDDRTIECATRKRRRHESAPHFQPEVFSAPASRREIDYCTVSVTTSPCAVPPPA